MQLPLTETYGRTLVFFALEVRSPLPPLSLSSIINEASRPKARAEDARGRPCRESYVGDSRQPFASYYLFIRWPAGRGADSRQPFASYYLFLFVCLVCTSLVAPLCCFAMHFRRS